MSLDVYLTAVRPTIVFQANITHNLGRMAREAGIYEACWHPEEIGIKTAGELVPLLTQGLTKLESNPDHYKQYNSPNGWGLYENFVPWLREYLKACQENPDAIVDVSR